MNLVEYIRVNFKNRVVSRPRTYTAVNNQDGSRTDTPAPGTVQQQGTPLKQETLNILDKGIADCAAAINAIGDTLQQIQNALQEARTNIGGNTSAINNIQEVNERQTRDIATLADAHNALAEDVEEIDQGVLADAKSHMENTHNPHNVTAAQLSGTLPVEHGGTGCTSSQQFIETFRLAPVSGVYEGNGATTRDINLGFHPKVVVYCDETSCFADDVKGTCGGVIVRGYPQYVWNVGYNGASSRSDSYKIAEIINTGFRLYNNSSTGHTGRCPNRSGVRYFYFAW